MTDGQRVIEEMKHQMEIWGSERDKVAEKLRELGKIKLDGIGKSILDNIQKIYRLGDVLHEAFQGMSHSLSDFFVTWVQTGKASFKELAVAMVKDLQMMAAQKSAELLMEAAYQGVMMIVDPNNLDPKTIGSSHAAAAMMALKGALIMEGFVAGSGLAGMAHKGIDSIPEDGTWLLKKKESVVDSRTNQDLKQFLTENKDGEKPPINMTVNINNSDEDGVMKALPKLKQMIIDTVHGDIAGNGPIRHAVMNYT